MGFEAIDFGFLASVLGIILVSMTIHEVTHGLVAYYLGDDTAKLQGRLTLNPIKHIDPFLTILLPIILALTPGAPIFGGAKPVPFNPTRVRHGEWGVALVAIAGPLTNLLIAFVCFGLLIVAVMGQSELLGRLLMMAATINLGFFVFNMLPIPPLDGSRALYALAPDSVRKGMAAIESFGIIGIFVIVMLAGSLIGPFMTSSINAILIAFSWIFGVS